MTPVLNAIKVPFHRASLGEEEIEAVSEVLRSGWLTMGAKTFEFERRFAEYIGVKYAIAVSSCTAALHLSLEAIELQVGDEVLLPTTTFTATAEVVAYFGAKPVFVDIDPITMNMSVADAKNRVTSRTRVIIPVHFAGQPCDMSSLRDLADNHELHVVEDAAHALPSTYKGHRVGTLSELTAFSFYATKTLTTGEGGMITTNNDAFAKRMQMVRLHGISRGAWNRDGAGGSWRYEVQEAGYKYNLTDLQSAIGLVQLAKCNEMSCKRQRIAEEYNRAFAKLNLLQTPEVLPDRQSSWHLYVLRLYLDRLRIGRDRFIEELGQRGIGASVHFIPLHLQPYYQKQFGYKFGDYPQAEHEYSRCISLPIYPGMSDEEVDYVVHVVSDIAQQWTR